MTEPTDAAIDTLILEHGVMAKAWPTQRQLHAFARAVLAKCGTPPAGAGEPWAWYVTGCSRLLDEDEAKAEARHMQQPACLREIE